MFWFPKSRINENGGKEEAKFISTFSYIPESTITSLKSRANNSVVLVEFWLNFTSNNSFKLFIDVLSNFAPSKDRSGRLVI